MDYINGYKMTIMYKDNEFLKEILAWKAKNPSITLIGCIDIEKKIIQGTYNSQPYFYSDKTLKYAGLETNDISITSLLSNVKNPLYRVSEQSTNVVCHESDQRISLSDYFTQEIRKIYESDNTIIANIIQQTVTISAEYIYEVSFNINKQKIRMTEVKFLDKQPTTLFKYLLDNHVKENNKVKLSKFVIWLNDLLSTIDDHEESIVDIDSWCILLYDVLNITLNEYCMNEPTNIMGFTKLNNYDVIMNAFKCLLEQFETHKYDLNVNHVNALYPIIVYFTNIITVDSITNNIELYELLVKIITCINESFNIDNSYNNIKKLGPHEEFYDLRIQSIVKFFETEN